MEDEVWKIKTPLGEYKTITRKKGEALHPEREDLEILQDIKFNSGEYHFARNISRCLFLRWEIW